MYRNTVLMGRTTFDWICEQEPVEKIYSDKECYVFTQTERPAINHIHFVHDNIVTVANAGAHHTLQRVIPSTSAIQRVKG